MTKHIEAGSVVHDADLDSIRTWFADLSVYVRAVDFVPARQLFVEDFLSFGSITDFMIGRDEAEATQWRKVWPTIDGFTFRNDIRALVSPDRLFAVGLAIFDSTGYNEDGTPFARAGRATVSFVRASIDGPWVSNHSHMSLFRGTPALSHGNKPAKS
jgi:ketosteroid isomerase-like protein